jgi:hypothetical protein
MRYRHCFLLRTALASHSWITYMVVYRILSKPSAERYFFLFCASFFARRGEKRDTENVKYPSDHRRLETAFGRWLSKPE